MTQTKTRTRTQKTKTTWTCTHYAIHARKKGSQFGDRLSWHYYYTLDSARRALRRWTRDGHDCRIVEHTDTKRLVD